MSSIQTRQKPVHNVHQVERIASVVAGGALAWCGVREGLKRHPVQGVALTLAGGALVRRGITGYCDIYRALGINNTNTGEPGANATIPYQQGVRVDRSITVNANREDVYAFWRNLDNLPRFMKYVRSVKVMDATNSHWIVDGPAGQKLEWDAEIINEIPNELLAWRSLPGASINNTGSVRFEHAAAGRGTRISISLQYDPPAGQLAVMFAKIFGKDADSEIDTDLHRFKNIIEAGEIPTSSGQPSGRTEDKAAQRSRSVNRQAEVTDASEASFPASDPPSYSHVNGR
jgi:uncharacterized membrane protein